jgi:Putative viral replication protein
MASNPRDRSGPRVKYWAFTLNNYTPADIDRLSSPIDGIDYLIFGKEAGDLGTPHLQGTACFSQRKRLTQVIAILGRCHVSPVRLLTQSIDYCKKDGDFTEWGNIPNNNQTGNNNEKENELEQFKQTVQQGVYDEKTIRELHSSVWASCEKFCRQYIDDHKPKHEVTAHPLKPWQAELYSKLILPAHERKIQFIIDLKGDTGKSWFARYYMSMHPETTQIVVPGRKQDMAYIIKEDTKVFFFDCPRSKQGEFIQYDFLEELKNGMIFSTKYESRVKYLATPHIVVLMNEHPDMSKLSSDRYCISILN